MKQMSSISQTFSVSYSYNLHFTKGLFTTDNPLFNEVLEKYKKEGHVKVLFVLDDGVAKAHPELQGQIEAYCHHYKEQISFTHTMVLPGGEGCKNDENLVKQVLQGINDYKICRHSFVIAIGGGAIIDMVGYAAAIAHRGVKLIRIPTTVLSQNDSAVGVKNSVNIFNKKNFLGTFAPPYAIINDSDFLATLEQRDWISGIAEAIKVALIKDDVFFNYIAEHAFQLRDRELEAMQYVIYRCAEMHMEHIAQGGDPFESGSSRPLDFGHWAAHKLEYMTHYSLRHGEAVAIGMALDVTYAHLIGLINKNTLEQILKVLTDIGFDIAVPLEKEEAIAELLNGIEEFREHLGGELTITLIDKIGSKYDVHTIDMNKMKEAISLLASLNSEKLPC